MEYTISVQPTPNPNALKFVLNVPAKTRDNASFKVKGPDSDQVPLADKLLKLESVAEVYFNGHFITVTQDGSADWDELETKVHKIITDNIPSHNPDFELQKQAVTSVVKLDGELGKIDEILDRTIRPALQRDGGDLMIMGLEDKKLTVSYQGACGSCPHSAMGTLYAIQSILRDQYDPELTVQLAGEMGHE